MGYAQFVQLKLDNKSGRELKIKDVYIHWGKLYQYPEKDQEVGKDTVENKSFASGSSFSLASCGRSDSASGTEGEFSLYDGSEQVMKVYWSCPWSGSNKFATYYVKEGWFPAATGWSTSGALGTITITIFKA
jgi:hypothetical protein